MGSCPAGGPIGAYGSQESYPSPEELAVMHARVVQANQPREAATGSGS